MRNISIISVIIAICGVTIGVFSLRAFTERVAKDKISEELARKINKEVRYLEKVNEISKLGALTTSSGDILPYRKLKDMYENEDNEDIKAAIKAEMMRIEFMYSFWHEESTEKFSWRDFKGRSIPTKGLVELLNSETDIKKRLSLIVLLGSRRDKETPDELLKIAENAKHIKELQFALSNFNWLFDYTSYFSDYDIEKAREWWNKPENKKIWIDKIEKKKGKK